MYFPYLQFRILSISFHCIIGLDLQYQNSSSEHGSSSDDLTHEDKTQDKKEEGKTNAPLIKAPAPLPPFLIPKKSDKESIPLPPPLEEPKQPDDGTNHLTVKQAQLRKKKEEARQSAICQRLVGG